MLTEDRTKLADINPASAFGAADVTVWGVGSGAAMTFIKIFAAGKYPTS
jgi:hypothetical protein